ncbi:hypothetical protein EVAR_56040_1 [Eumeta japonica]|uniref:Uncharacterized protein n=1 Tax=Eumeta variegata TaxID=151549 RepID=A0A4C1YAD6_EUMVA|nr:hypothetical protein EVAR_56040_1 [Eumeta japonica]
MYVAQKKKATKLLAVANRDSAEAAARITRDAPLRIQRAAADGMHRAARDASTTPAAPRAEIAPGQKRSRHTKYNGVGLTVAARLKRTGLGIALRRTDTPRAAPSRLDVDAHADGNTCGEWRAAAPGGGTAAGPAPARSPLVAVSGSGGCGRSSRARGGGGGGARSANVTSLCCVCACARVKSRPRRAANYHLPYADRPDTAPHLHNDTRSLRARAPSPLRLRPGPALSPTHRGFALS